MWVWSLYLERPKRNYLKPGYWGSLEDEELEFIQKALENNPKLSYAWGFKTDTEKESSQRYPAGGNGVKRGCTPTHRAPVPR